MILKEINQILGQILGDKVTRLVAIAVPIFTLSLAYYSALAGIIVFLNYIFGFVLCYTLTKYKSNTTVYLQRLSSFYKSKSGRKRLINSCSICDDLSCRRHQQIKSAAPWKHLVIQKDLNAAVEKFYSRIIDNFILSWYGQFTKDEDFIIELRYCLKYASSSIITRFLELDTSHIIINKLVPCAIKHIDDYLYMQQISKLKSDVRFNEIVVEYLGKRLHAATVSRKSELEYLQLLVSKLMTRVLPDGYLKCKNFSLLIREILAGWVFLPMMDSISDPNILNLLVIRALKFKSKATNDENAECVEFLHNFTLSNPKKQSAFYTGLNKIKANTQMLYAFMQYLKKHECVNLLQFCLDVDDFNNTLLRPELTKEQLEELHTKAQKLYKEYLKEDNFNFIGCSREISEYFHDLLKGGVHDVAKLRTSKPLFQAYEYTFNVLENVWLPQFFHSNEFYTYICGPRVNATFDKKHLKNVLTNFGSPVRLRKYNELPNQSTVSKISSGIGKIKGVLKSNQPVDGALYPECQNVENGTIDDLMITETPSIFRDLRTWRVSIVDYKSSPSNKDILFHINIQRFDSIPEDGKRAWDIFRKDQDFFILKSKLIEFHGESEISDSPLPSRKGGTTIDSKMLTYQNFIKKLLLKHSLRGSDLLYTFLTTEEDFSLLMANSTQAGQDLGNIYQSVAHKLRKEKGQNLDPFMTAFLNSTGKAKQGKFDWPEFADEVDVIASSIQRHTKFPKTYRNSTFNDNFGITLHQLKQNTGSAFNPVGITESIYYLLRYIFKVSNGVLKLFVALSSFCHQIFELSSKLFIEKKLNSALCQSNLAYLVGLLEELIFDGHSSATSVDVNVRKNTAFADLKKATTSTILNRILGTDISNGCTTILELLQNPHYNKQLAYNLLDIIMAEMYPFLDKD